MMLALRLLLLSTAICRQDGFGQETFSWLFLHFRLLSTGRSTVGLHSLGIGQRLFNKLGALPVRVYGDGLSLSDVARQMKPSCKSRHTGRYRCPLQNTGFHPEAGEKLGP